MFTKKGFIMAETLASMILILFLTTAMFTVFRSYSRTANKQAKDAQSIATEGTAFLIINQAVSEANVMTETSPSEVVLDDAHLIFNNGSLFFNDEYIASFKNELILHVDGRKLFVKTGENEVCFVKENTER